MADWVGRKLGKVQIQSLIARGGMAEIYTGIHEEQGLVAVKVMRGLLENDEHQLARFRREAEVIGDLRHPNIVRMIDFVVVDETPCLIMDYVPGPSLAAYMKAIQERNERIPIVATAQILRSIANALDFAHSRGVVHRDIKPANVLLRSPTQDISIDKPLPVDIEPILTDFGLVRLLDSTLHTTTGSVSGTPTYMSPEQARGEKVDERTDIYSLGVMLYEMIAGSVPFQADTTFGMLMKHINEPPQPIKGISPDLQAVLDRALAKDPALRYESAGAMANEFLAIFNGQTISPRTLQMAEMARKLNEEINSPKKETQQISSRFRWVRVAIEGIAAFLLIVIIYQFINPITPKTVTATEVPRDPNIPAGRLKFGDFSNIMDEVTLSLNNADLPTGGYEYQAWLVSDDKSATHKLGTITFNSAGIGSLGLIDPEQQNLFKENNQLIVSEEPIDSENAEPTGEIVYSSVYPPEALAATRNLVAGYESTPNNLALIQGLWYYSGSYINISINGYTEDPNQETVGLVDAYKNGDELTIQKRTEEIVNQIVGASSDLYLDHDGDGQIDDTTDGFGSFPNGDSPGYLQETALQAKLAANAIDSTSNIRTNGADVQVCIQNMDDWLNRILQLALKLNDMPFGVGMEPIVSELETLGDVLIRGVDANQNGLIEPISGECGANSAYEFSYTMADMLIYPGVDRVPPTGK